MVLFFEYKNDQNEIHFLQVYYSNLFFQQSSHNTL